MSFFNEKTGKIPQKSFNEECPVCLDEISEEAKIHITPCLHRIHVSCAENLVTFACPLCNQKINNYPIYIVEKILEYKKKYEEKIENEDFTELRRLERIRQERILQTLQAQYGNDFLKGPVKKEIMSVMMVLRDLKVPVRYIPVEIKVTIYQGQPRTPPSFLFYNLLALIMKKICHDLGDYNPELDNAAFFEYEVEDSFNDENSEFSHVNRGIDIQVVDE
jgi:hypothetical protein